jgi:hypothetical protein
VARGATVLGRCDAFTCGCHHPDHPGYDEVTNKTHACVPIGQCLTPYNDDAPCRCPTNYAGSRCQDCAPGYHKFPTCVAIPVVAGDPDATPSHDPRMRFPLEKNTQKTFFFFFLCVSLRALKFRAWNSFCVVVACFPILVTLWDLDRHAG